MDRAASELAIETPEQQRDVVDLEERTWLKRHCRGDSSAFPALLQAYRRPVYNFLVRHGVAADERDDVFQIIFLKIHTAAASYDPTRPLAPWLFAIVANAVRNHFRDQPIPFEATASDGLLEAPDPNPGPDQVAQDRETVAWLEGALDALPLAQREVLLLTTVIGLRQQEVAQALSLPLNTVKTRLRRARLALAAGLAGRDAVGGSTGDTHEHV